MVLLLHIQHQPELKRRQPERQTCFPVRNTGAKEQKKKNPALEGARRAKNETKPGDRALRKEKKNLKGTNLEA